LKNLDEKPKSPEMHTAITHRKTRLSGKQLVVGLSFLLPLFSHGAERVLATYPGDVDHLAFRAVERRENDRLKVMLRDGLSPHLRAPDGSTLLMYAALHGDAEGVRILLDAGADPNAANDDGVTALIWGAGDLEKTRRLVEAGADVNATSQEKMTPLLAAARRVNATDCIRYLVAHGAAINSAENGTKLLESAAYAGDMESVRFLLENLQRLDQAGEEIAPLVGISARWGQHDIIDAIFKQAQTGRFTVTDRVLGMGLKQALQVSDAELISFFLKQGARNPGLIDATYGDRGVSLETLRSLVEGGADVHATGFRGFTALDYARLRGDKTTEDFLTSLGVESRGDIRSPKIPARTFDWETVDQTQLITDAVGRSFAADAPEFRSFSPERKGLHIVSSSASAWSGRRGCHFAGI
jgi:ankyrin repeat protein